MGRTSWLCPVAMVSRTVLASVRDNKPRDTYKKTTSDSVEFKWVPRKSKAAWKPKLWFVLSGRKEREVINRENYSNQSKHSPFVLFN